MKKFLALILCMLMVLSLAACGAGGNSEAASGAKDSITIASNVDYDKLHPADVATEIESFLVIQIYDSLAIRDYEDQTHMIPRVAESWEVSEDGLCYTFHLRQGVKFHDGSEVTADDVGFSLDLFQNSEYQSSVVDGMDHWEVVDPYTINIYTTEVYSPFLLSVGTNLFIASKAYYESVDEEAFAQNPVGCGPYKWVSHNEGDSWQFEAFEDYYGGVPEIKTVNFKVIGDTASMAIGLKAGQLDFAKIDASVMSTLEATEGVEIEFAPTTGFAFIAMNNTKYPFTELAFRQAVNYAVDREAIVDAIEEGYATPNSNMLTPERQGWSASQKTYTYDVAKAKELLASIGLQDGIDLGKFYVPESYALLAQVVQSQLQQVGITFEIEQLEANAFYSKLFAGDYTMSCMHMSLEGDTQQVGMGVCMEGGYANNAIYQNPKMDELFAKAATTIDNDERTKVYEEIFSIVQEDVPYAILYNPEMIYARSSALNIHTLPLEGYYYLQDFSWAE